MIAGAFANSSGVQAEARRCYQADFLDRTAEISTCCSLLLTEGQGVMQG